MVRLILPPKVRERVEQRRQARLSWLSFIQWCHVHPSPQWVFRGQSQRWPLKPTVGRQGYKPEAEIQILNEFKRHSVSYHDTSFCRDDWDWLALAQHHGLPTRLLDWTYNPLVAAFFASAPSPRGKKNGSVAAIETRHYGFSDEQGAAGLAPFEIEAMRFLRPPAHVHRIRSQKGLFSVHPLPNKPFLTQKIETFEIPADQKADFQRSVYTLGVDSGFLMADLDGLCKTLKWRSENGALI